jgi:hypothetical protein
MGDDVARGHLSDIAVRECDLSSGSVRTLATSAGWPVISWPWTAWLVSTGNGTGYVQVSNRQTGESRRIAATPPMLALDDATLAYPDAQSLSVWLLDDLATGTAPRMIARGTDVTDHLEWVTLNARIVAWSQSSATQVYDRAEQHLVTLPVTRGRSAVYVCGPLVVWEDNDMSTPAYRGWANRELIIDSSRLPVHP